MVHGGYADHEIVRRGLRNRLESEGDIRVVGEASTADQAVRRVQALDPDVAVLDVRLAEGNGVESCRAGARAIAARA
jgi:DNA-binding NarL/FixJ family response regulator